MKWQEKIKNKIDKMNFKASPEMNKRILENALKAQTKTKSAASQPNIWRIIMKKPVIKLVTAAMVILIAILGITILDKSTTPAYAIEQTIEAFKNVRFMHIIRRSETGQLEDERWIEIGPDGIQARYRQDTPPNFLVVDNLKNILIYHKNKNMVLLYGPDAERYTWISNPGEFFKDLAGEGSITIKENVDYWGQKAHLVRWLKLNQDCYIDPESKLPIAMGSYEISYENPPENTFDIVIPDGVKIIDKRPGAEPIEEPEWMRNEVIAQEKFNEARKALFAGEYQEAAKLFKKVIEIQPGRNWAWFWLGKAHYEMGEYNAAIYEFSKVIEMFSGHNVVPHYCHLARGFAYQAKGMEAMAKRDFTIALPVMINALRNIEAAGLFDFADDPLRSGGGFISDECHENPSQEQSFIMMIDRLREVTGHNFGYDADASAEEKELTIAAWEQWWSETTAE